MTDEQYAYYKVHFEYPGILSIDDDEWEDLEEDTHPEEDEDLEEEDEDWDDEDLDDDDDYWDDEDEDLDDDWKDGETRTFEYEDDGEEPLG